MMQLPEIDDFETLLCNDVPLLDVRAPTEFLQGAFPCSSNAPLLNDEERKKVGTCYKHEGHDAAVELGAKLISGAIKEQRVASWVKYFAEHPDAALYCFRGGMRSEIVQRWVYEASGLVVPRVRGGYKALRRFLIDSIELLAGKLEPVILAGRTGTGKTLLIRELDCAIDLEGLANHRGSSFGRQVDPQPTQINFENRLAIELLRLYRSGARCVVLEDESPNIGSLHIPHPLYQCMSEAPGVVLEAPLEARVDITLKEYVTDMLARYVQATGDRQKGFTAFCDYLRNSLARVRRRLGGQAYLEILALMDAALEQQAATGRVDAHRESLQRMLVDYYDPMYDYQREKRGREIIKTGRYTQLRAYLGEYCCI